VRDDDGAFAARIVLAGELDLATASLFESQLESAIERAVIIVDLRKLEFIGSTGLALLVRAHERMCATGRRLVLIRGPRQVQRVFELTGVVDLFEVAEEPDQVCTAPVHPRPVPANRRGADANRKHRDLGPLEADRRDVQRVAG
jgi:anti-anti-sigma factor